jgi:hypothetical protein
VDPTRHPSSTAEVPSGDEPPVSNLDEVETLDGAPTATGPPVIPLVMLGITTIAACALTIGALLEGAGSTDAISDAALLAWALGSFLGLVEFAWFGSLDARRRATGRYVEADWRPRTVGLVLAVIGWIAGAAGAVLVAQAVARR